MSKQNIMVIETETFPAMADFIDWLFRRLGAKYGAQWSRKWGDVPMLDVKSDWGCELAPYFGRKDVIAYVLQNLPELPPNSIEFRNICRRAPAAPVPQLPQPKADPARVRAVLAELAPAAAVGRLDWARALQRKDADNPSSVTQTIRKMYRDALGLNRVLPANEDAAAQGAQA